MTGCESRHFHKRKHIVLSEKKEVPSGMQLPAEQKFGNVCSSSWKLKVFRRVNHHEDPSPLKAALNASDRCLNLTVFWDVAPCSLVEADQCFRGALKYWSVSTRLHGATSKKTVTFILTAIRTQNLTTDRRFFEALRNMYDGKVGNCRYQAAWHKCLKLCAYEMQLTQEIKPADHKKHVTYATHISGQIIKDDTY
jgi:hypothetical protein